VGSDEFGEFEVGCVGELHCCCSESGEAERDGPTR